MRIPGVSVIILGLGLAACSNGAKSDKEIDSINQAAADSLLRDALSDDTVTTKQQTADPVLKDSL